MSSSRFLSIDSPKAIKAQGYGYINAINYMAPAATAGVGNLCPHASPGCLALCLGWYSGQAAMLANHELETGSNATRLSRQRKAQLFMRDRPEFMRQLVRAIEAAQRRAQRSGLKLCVRLNGATDIAWEAVAPVLFVAFPWVQFVDYTKSVKRALRSVTDRRWPSNYHLTFSRSETNEDDCKRVLEAGGNVAVVFRGDKPTLFMGAPVIDGDAHDLRHLDPRAGKISEGGVIIGLTPKGRKARTDVSGFVVD